MWTNLTTNLFVDSYSTDVRPRLHGYVFTGPDFTFRWDHDQYDVPTVPPSGLDGSYLSVWETVNGTKIGVDHDGNRRLFLYRHGDYVAVGDSLIGLARKVRDLGHALTLRPHHLAAWTIEGAFNQQLWSFDTAFEEISLLPQTTDVLVRPTTSTGLCHLVPTRRNDDDFFDRSRDYSEALGEYLQTWTRRAATLASRADCTITTDLSGGLDSRTVFSLLRGAFDDTDSMHGRLRVFSGRADYQKRDLEVARQIVGTQGMELASSRRPNDASTVSSSPTQRWDHWVANRLGQYVLTRRLPRHRPDPTLIAFGGVGGEKHRPFYTTWFSDLDDLFAQRRARWLSDDAVAEDFEASVRRGLRRIQGRIRGHPDPLVVHYRYFRSRFHGGCPSAEKIKITPMSGRHADLLAHSAGPGRFSRRQTYYDLIANTAPDLLDVPFDETSKHPTDRNREDITRVDVGPVSPGRLDLGRPDPTPSCVEQEHEPATLQFEQRYREALPDVPPALRPDPDKMDELFAGARRRGYFRRQSDMQRVHQVILDAECRRLATASQHP